MKENYQIKVNYSVDETRIYVYEDLLVALRDFNNFKNHLHTTRFYENKTPTSNTPTWKLVKNVAELG